MFPVCGQRGVALNSKETSSLPLHVLHTAEQLVVGVLDEGEDRETKLNK